MYKIYKITNIVNGKVYVGKTKQTIQKRFNNHLQNAKRKTNRHLYDSMNYYGYNSFIIECIEDNLIKEIVDERECFWIYKLDCISPKGYNMTKGGGGGFTIEHWPVEKRKQLYKQQAAKRKGKKRTPEQRKRMSVAAGLRQQSYTEEQKINISKKISETNKRKGIQPPKEYQSKPGCDGFFKGKTHSKEAREKISKARKGKKYEDIMHEDVANRLKNMHSEMWSGKNNPNYVEFTIEQKQKICNILKHQKLKMTEISDIVGISLWVLRKWFREVGIDNYQKLTYISDNEWRSKWNQIGLNLKKV